MLDTILSTKKIMFKTQIAQKFLEKQDKKGTIFNGLCRSNFSTFSKNREILFC